MSIPLDEVIHFDVVTHNPSTGAVADADSTPTFAVFEESTDTDIGVGGNLTKRTSLTGNYRGSFTASAANGFEVGKFYSVIASATVNSIAGKTVALSFRVSAAEGTAGYDPIADSAITAAKIASDAITASKIASDAITAAKIATDAITAAKIASDAITAAKIADNALTSTKFAAGAFDAVWGVSARTLTSVSGLGIATAAKLTSYFRLALRKDAAIATDNATELTEINADGGSGGGAYANTSDSQEAIRDNQLSASAVNDEVVDALATDTYAEPTGAPGATVSLSAKISYLYMALRNRVTVTASAKTFHDDSGSAEFSKALSDDGTTYTEDEAA